MEKVMKPGSSKTMKKFKEDFNFLPNENCDNINPEANSKY